MILNETVAAIADAIREKTGKSELIKPIDFAEEIKGITAGGGDAPSDDYEYYDISQLDGELISCVAVVSTLLKKAYVKNGVVSNIQIGSFFFAYVDQDYEKLIAMAINVAQPCIDINGARTLGEEIVNNPDTELAFIVSAIRSCPKITKEQFYSLE